MGGWEMAFLAAAGVGLFTCLLHLIVGGRELVRPLLATDGLRPVTKLTHYFCWHLVTIGLAAMAIGYLYAARSPDGRDVAAGLTALAALAFAWNLWLGLRHGRRFIEMPQWSLFGAIAALGAAGLVL